MDNEAYVAISLIFGQSIDLAASPLQPGFLNTTHQGRQCFANRLGVRKDDPWTLWISESEHGESIDFSPRGGNSIEITSSTGQSDSALVGLYSTYNGLLLFKRNDIYSLLGNSPSNYVLKKIHDDGVDSTHSIKEYEGGVIFAGRRGIYACDGVEVVNLTEASLGPFYTEITDALDWSTVQCHAMIDRDQYFVSFHSITATDRVRPVRGSTYDNPTQITFCVNLKTKAVTMMSNLDIYGSVNLPAEIGGGALYLVHTANDDGRICLASDLFEGTAEDVLTCLNQTIGPRFWMESKAYDFGFPMLKKLCKQLALTYYSANSDLSLDTVPGLNEAGSTSSSTYPLFNGWQTKRIKFIKRAQHFRFRLYETSNGADYLRIGPWSIGYKPMRPGKV
jgi:hypothetical protein